MDRGAWQATVMGVAKESDITATKQQGSLRYRTMMWLKVHAWNSGLGFLAWEEEKSKAFVELHRRRKKINEMEK